MKRIILLVLCVVLLVSIVAAQEATLGLSAPDALLLAAAHNAALNSFSFEYTFHLAEDLDTFAVSAELSGSGAVDREAPALSATLVGGVTLGSSQHIPFDAELRLVEHTLYLNTGDDWQALEDAPTVLSDVIGDITRLEVDTVLLSGWDLMGVDGLSDILTTIAAADPSTFMMAERLDDEGQTAHFQITVDLHALFDSDAFADAINALAHAQGSDLIIHSRDEIAEIVRTNNLAVDPAVLTIDEYIGLDDSLIHRIAVNLEMQVAPAEAEFSSEPFSVSLGFDATLSGHNQPQDIVAPDGATVVDALTLPTPELAEEPVTQYFFLETMDEGATDTYTFEAQQGEVVTITARRLSLDFDPNITLLSPSGENPVENDDNETSAYFASAYDSQIFDYALPESGTYSVEVREFGGLAGSYTLTIAIKR